MLLTLVLSISVESCRHTLSGLNKVTHVKGTNYVLVGRPAHCLVSVYGSAKPSAAFA